MSSVPKKRLTAQEYLAIERHAPYRSEFYQGEMFAMAGASWEHNLIKDNLAYELRSRLQIGPCKVLTSDLRVKVASTGLYTYPDLVVVCEKPRFEDTEVDTLLNPSVLVEVLSESTESYDRGQKFDHYDSLPTVKEYVLIAQDRPMIERFVRQPDGSWLMTRFGDLALNFTFGTLPATIPLAKIYQDVGFQAPG